jgi:hypothetical protein
MSFDIDIAVAKITSGVAFPEDHISTQLRDKYPELDFLFDEIDSLRQTSGEYAAEAKAEIEKAQGTLSSVIDAVASCRDLIDTVRSMDAAKPVALMLRDVSRKLDAEVQCHG